MWRNARRNSRDDSRSNPWLMADGKTAQGHPLPSARQSRGAVGHTWIIERMKKGTMTSVIGHGSAHRCRS